MNNKPKIWNVLFKTIVILLSYLYIVNRLKDFDFSSFINFDFTVVALFLLVLLLMFINWSLESIKWQMLVDRVEKTGFWTSLKTVLVGIIFGLFTPNRIGEIGGRSLYLKPSNRIKGVVAASVGSYAQMTVTVVLGLFGFGVILFFFGAFGLDIKTLKVIGIVFVSVACLLIFFFFNMDLIVRFLNFLRLPKKIIDKILLLNEYSTISLFNVLVISILRYSVFVFQYYILLLIFNVQIDFFIAIAGILSVFLIMNLLPNLVIADLGIRGSVSIFVLGQFAENLQGILSASILLWIINILLPVIIGQALFIKTKPAF